MSLKEIEAHAYQYMLTIIGSEINMVGRTYLTT